MLTIGEPVTVNWTLSAPHHPFRISTQSSDPFVEPGSDVLTEVVDPDAKTTTLTLHKLDTDLYYTCPNPHNFIGVLVERKALGAETTLAVASSAASECTCVRGKSLDADAPRLHRVHYWIVQARGGCAGVHAVWKRRAGRGTAPLWLWPARREQRDALRAVPGRREQCWSGPCSGEFCLPHGWD